MAAGSLNSKKLIFFNAISSFSQVIVTGVVYFFLYRFLLSRLDVKQLGVWSLVLSASSLANMANFGITSSMVKYIAEYNALGKLEKLPALVFTGLISLSFFFLAVVVILYFLAHFLLYKIIDADYLQLALAIFPYSLACLFISAVSGVFTSVLDGFQKGYIKNFVYIFSTLLFLVLNYVLVPLYGLKGVAIAQLCQTLVVFILIFLTSGKNLPFSTFTSWNWRNSCFKELVSYGVKFQVISIFQMLYEPTTKILLSRFGGLSLVGFYEMASRVVTQLRMLIVSANQVIVPVVAHNASVNNQNVSRIYKAMMSLIFFVNVPLITAVIIGAPLVSLFWIGHVEPLFVISVFILAAGYFMNIMSGPAYFSSLGEGKLNSLLVMHFFMGLLNLVLGFALGKILSGYGVVLAWGISLAVCSLLFSLYYQKTQKITLHSLFNLKDALLIIMGVSLSAAAIILYMGNYNILATGFFKKDTVMIFVYLVFIIPILLWNPNFKELLLHVTGKVQRA